MAEETRIETCCDKSLLRVSDEAFLILGAANAGLVGTIAAGHIIEKLDLVEVAHLHSSSFPPISVFIDGVLKHPFRIYADTKNEDGSPARVFVATTELPLNRETYHELAHVLVEYIQELGIKTIVTLVGFPVQDVDEYEVFYAAEPTIIERLKQIEGIQPLPKGLIYGIEALVLNETLERAMDGFSLIVPVKEYLPATKAAAAMIDALNKIFSLDVDTKELVERDDQLQEKLKELAEQIRRNQAEGPDQYMAPPPSKSMNSLFT